MKKLLMVVISVVLICNLFSFSILADEINDENDHLSVEENASLSNPDSPTVYTPCPYGNGICQMYRRGNAFVYNAQTGACVLDNVPCWQCVNCYTVIATSGDPGSGYSIGYYAFHSCNYQVGAVGTYFSIPNSSALYYTSSSSLQGYNFIYHQYK